MNGNYCIIAVIFLLDELLSTIPNSQRTLKVLNNIHTMIERFKQLREKFSLFDEYGNIQGILVNESDYKPLIKYFTDFGENLLWILPIVKNVKKVYNIANHSNYQDIETINIFEDTKNLENIMNSYKANSLPENQNKYTALFNELNPYFTPFDYVNEEYTNDIIYEKKVGDNINTIVDNLGDFYSSIVQQEAIRTRRFVTQKYNLGLNKLDATSITNNRMITQRVKLTNPDVLSIKSFLTLPEPVIRFSRINLHETSIMDRANLNNVFS